jgi:hypothetical protein
MRWRARHMRSQLTPGAPSRPCVSAVGQALWPERYSVTLVASHVASVVDLLP